MTILSPKLFLAVMVAAIISIPLTGNAASSQAQVEKAVKKYFASTPEMIAIARCESEFRQFDESGDILRGGYEGKMIGIFQFHEDYHRGAARDLGLNIDTMLGNLAYAKKVYAAEGTTPWNSSKHCWGENAEENTEIRTSGTFTETLMYKDVHEEVRTLQKYLNQKGYPVALSGPGAKGHETNYFGSMTRLALRRFQCKEISICRGDQEYGTVGEKTREVLNNAIRTEE